MPFFEAPSKPLPPGYPLPAVDARGRPIRAGQRVLICAIPAWLTHDLPEDDIARLEVMEGKVLPILEVDAYGYVWFGEKEPWFSLRPDDIVAMVDESVVEHP